MRAAFFVFSQPMAPRLPLPSRSKTTSSFLAQRVSAGFGLSSTQACLLHGRWVNLATAPRTWALAPAHRWALNLAAARLQATTAASGTRRPSTPGRQGTVFVTGLHVAALRLCCFTALPSVVPWSLKNLSNPLLDATTALCAASAPSAPFVKLAMHRASLLTTT
eukprot:CAMPEP_0172913022 /NCGR_PEP_ID=MMETSP1075-20121228/189554_1 /TAXON_ID=2916 /ORGANISM="Ceratium fusus, Strain PA161109" /LENGTH=163 /DNA_ID=CAMNT_0013771645 /DNA_START=514 /DNA_END=1000 /DNA_ORIENTATION=+